MDLFEVDVHTVLHPDLHLTPSYLLSDSSCAVRATTQTHSPLIGEWVGYQLIGGLSKDGIRLQ